MRESRLFSQLYLSFLAITVLCLVGLTWLTARSMRDFYLAQTASDLEARARLVEPAVRRSLQQGSYGELHELCTNLGRRSATRITVILPEGKVIGDTHQEPDQMDNHLARPEVRRAMAGRPGTAVRFSRTLGTEMMYLALPLQEGDRVIGVLRTSMPVLTVRQTLRGLYSRLSLTSLLLVALAAVVILLISRRISRPLERIRAGAERFARGELDYKLAGSGTSEVSSLAATLNSMAAGLSDRIQTVIRQRSELEVLLASMVEGVIAIDPRERVTKFNRAAGEILGVDPARAVGRSIQEAVRLSDLHQLVRRTLSAGRPAEGEIAIRGEREIFLQARASILLDADSRPQGCVVVLHDISHLRRLENVRRDFVANVSHELKTPVTSIKGFAETLAAGAVEDQQDRRRFLGIIVRQAERLSSLIDDILSLARLEDGKARSMIGFEPGEVGEVLAAAIDLCRPKADQRQVTLSLDCPAALSARMNSKLLEQAVINLVDNAIKFSEPGGPVRVTARAGEGRLSIEVSDQGCGIEQLHLDRIFERFYRVDKARSRALGGTGLGLAIVKHIAQVHDGTVAAASRPGHGSTFTLTIPLEAPPLS